ncbi:hypothetical protein DYB32_005855 [Aphanomyces invadans]|uniref:t-SNARE coiled-coil homology domain-containing protein n=1 Tax=Aphanomyces invadans TaxID=157072 RepID=A0A3R6WKB8_9STRA|nr:hypothetical protein DYB32_005855 [Aphanomyces invadans]
MAEIAYYDGDLSDALTKLDQIMAKLAKAPPGIKSEVLVEAEKKLKEVIDLKKGFSLALRQVTDREEIKSYREVKLHLHQGQLTREVKWAKSETDRNGLFGDAKAKASKVPTGNTDLLNKAQELQGKTEVSLKNTQKMIENSKEVALATGETLREQRNQLNAITEEVMRMDDGVARANKVGAALFHNIDDSYLTTLPSASSCGRSHGEWQRTASFCSLHFSCLLASSASSCTPRPIQTKTRSTCQTKSNPRIRVRADDTSSSSRVGDVGVITNATGINSFINNTQNSITGK